MMSVQTYLNENREELFNSVAGLITAEFHDNPPRIVLVVNKLLKELPVGEVDGQPIVFEQMILGGTIIDVDNGTPPIPISSTVKTPAVVSDQQVLDQTFGKELPTPFNSTSRNKDAVEAWKARNSKVKVV